MTTSQTPSVLSEINGEQPIPLKTRQYFRRLLQDRIHELVLQAFIDQEKREGLTQKQLAGRLEKDQAQISRWLLTAGNWEFDTLADLLLGMAVRLNELSVTRIADLITQILSTIKPIEKASPAPQPSQPNPSPAGQSTNALEMMPFGRNLNWPLGLGEDPARQATL